MEVDPPTSTTPPGTSSGGGTLKRSNSAPMINVLVSSESYNQPCTSSSFKFSDSSRLRRFSSSNMSLNSAMGMGLSIKIPDRINQIKQEESHLSHRETAGEKVVRSAIQFSTSWDCLSLDDQDTSSEGMLSIDTSSGHRPRSFSESLHIMPSPSLLCGSPSPTRVGKQCFSPSMHVPIKSSSFSPSPSPSPTRKTFIRSLSPIAMRPNLSRKRKFESDSDRSEYLSPPKKFNTNPSPPERDRVLAHPLAHSVLAHPLAHSISGSSIEDRRDNRGSPYHPLPTTVQSHQNKELYDFMPLRDNNSQDIHMSDSEHLEMSESHDMTESHDNINMVVSSSSESSRSFQPIKHGHV